MLRGVPASLPAPAGTRRAPQAPWHGAAAVLGEVGGQQAGPGPGGVPGGEQRGAGAAASRVSPSCVPRTPLPAPAPAARGEGGSPFPRGAAPLFQPPTRQGLKEGNQTAAYDSASSMFRVLRVCLIKGILRRRSIQNPFVAARRAQSGCSGLGGGKPFSTTPVPPRNQPRCFKGPSPRPQLPSDPNFPASSQLCRPGWAGEGTKHKPHRGRARAGGFGVGEGTARGTLPGGEGGGGGTESRVRDPAKGWGWEKPTLKCSMGPLRKPHRGLRAGCPPALAALGGVFLQGHVPLLGELL